MAFNVTYKLVENHDQQFKCAPWLCDRCHSEDKILLKITVDYETIVMCKKCLFEGKKLITGKEKELKDVRKRNKQPKER